jgi:hypothetical protein
MDGHSDGVLPGHLRAPEPGYDCSNSKHDLSSHSLITSLLPKRLSRVLDLQPRAITSCFFLANKWRNYRQNPLEI